ncbi:MAG: GAF domain-containing protein, partial [Gemmatimonadota bacterium]
LPRRWPGLRFSEAAPAGLAGQRVITFQPAAGTRQRGPRQPEPSWAAAGPAEPGALAGALDSIASEVREDLQLAAANIVLHADAGAGHREILGGAGFAGTAEERRARMERCDALGAEFKHREALRGRRLVVVPHRYDSVMRDARWAPAHNVLETVAWDGFAAVPLAARGRVVGTLSAFYPAGRQPAPPAGQRSRWRTPGWRRPPGGRLAAGRAGRAAGPPAAC